MQWQTINFLKRVYHSTTYKILDINSRLNIKEKFRTFENEKEWNSQKYKIKAEKPTFTVQVDMYLRLNETKRQPVRKKSGIRTSGT
tara:strand:- start:294 stop:551 length:258 start_codon:yes stop_codon:yes gene_type:complete